MPEYHSAEPRINDASGSASSWKSTPSHPNVFHEATQFYKKVGVTMGDRSPKAVQKQASQKKARTDSADQKKKQDLAAKAKVAVGKKK
jgi:hypothetical protein